MSSSWTEALFLLTLADEEAENDVEDKMVVKAIKKGKDKFNKDKDNKDEKDDEVDNAEEEPPFEEEELEEEEVEEEEELIAGTEKPIPKKPSAFPVCRKPVIFIFIIHIIMTFVESEINAITDYLRFKGYSYLKTRKIYEVYMMAGGFFCFFQAILADCYFSRLKTLIYGYIPQAISLVLFFSWYYMKFNEPAMWVAVIMASTSAGALSSVIISIGLNQFEYPEQYWSARNFMYIYMIEKSLITMGACSMPYVLKNYVLPPDAENAEGYVFGVIFGYLFIGVLFVIIVRKKVPDKQLDVGRFLTYGRIVGRAIKLNRELDEEIPGHFLDVAKPQFGDYLVDSLKQILVLLVISIPLFMFWSFYFAEVSVVQQEYNQNLYDFKTFAGELTLEYIQPMRHMLMIINVLIYKFIITTILQACNVKINFVKEILAGMFILILRYFVYHYLIDATSNTFEPVILKNGSFNMRIYNPTECPLNLLAYSLAITHFKIAPMNYVEIKYIPYFLGMIKEYEVETTCPFFKLEGTMEFKEQQTVGAVFFRSGDIKFFQDTAAHTTKHDVPVKIIVVLEFEDDKRQLRLTGENGFSINIPNLSVEPLMIPPGQYNINTFKFTVCYNEATVILVYVGETTRYRDIKIRLKNRINLYRVFPDLYFGEWGEFLYTIGAFQFYYFNGPAGLKTISLACHYMFTRGLSQLSAHIIHLYMFRDSTYWRSNYLDQVICVLIMIISMYLFPSVIFKFRNSWKWIKTEESTA